MRVPFKHFLYSDFIVHHFLGDWVIVISNHLDCIKLSAAVPSQTHLACPSFADAPAERILHSLN